MGDGFTKKRLVLKMAFGCFNVNKWSSLNELKT